MKTYPVIKHHAMKTYWRVVSFTPRPLYPWGKNPQHPFDRRLGWTPEQVWTRWRWVESSCP